jgi:hypothetical protein
MQRVTKKTGLPGMATAPQKRRISRTEAAQKIATLLEDHMDSEGWSEEKKNKRVAGFRKAVVKDLGGRPRRPK